MYRTKNLLKGVSLLKHCEKCLICNQGYINCRNFNRESRNNPLLTSNNGVSQNLERLVEAYRNYGHKIANVNPLDSFKNKNDLSLVELDPALYSLALSDVISEQDNISIDEIVNNLRKLYCGEMSLETMMVESKDEREWLHACFADVVAQPIEPRLKKQICRTLDNSQTFDKFLGTKFPTLKRYSCEGAESMLVFMEHCIDVFALAGVKQAFIGMPHRGRNNLLVESLHYPVELMLRKIKGLSEFPPEAHTVATGDVLSHLGISTDILVEDKSIHVNLLQNSSFLEGVNPVAMGKCRGRQQTLEEKEDDRKGSAACILVHGDAAFSGQGVVMECMNMSRLKSFDIGGTIHLVVNNQIGFTTPPGDGRSSLYASDVGKTIGCPVIHVNGSNPEMVWKAAEIAVKYRDKHRSDIIVDMLCFRRWGHNEMDNPTFTQPLMYDVIHARPSIPDAYTSQLLEEKVLSSDTVEDWRKDLNATFNKAYKECDSFVPPPSYLHPDSPWGALTIPCSDHATSWETGCHADELRFIGAKSLEVKKDFQLHSHLKKTHADVRLEKLQTNSPIDWALAETFAFGSLLNQGYDVRLCGQDVGRGTFSHRHAALTCQDSGRLHYPLNHMTEGQKGRIEVASSLLSEEAVLGFEYGMSIESPRRLVVWEAQFGDFFTTAQTMVDTLVMSGEAKWMYQSGLVLLLPHGYDGAGPEHSSCRIERFLQSTTSSETGVDSDNVNASVCHPTTAAQYFHLLRRQMIRDFRKPLIVASPKILLRFPAAASSLGDFTEGTRFQSVIDDHTVKVPQTVKKVIFCTGKHYYALAQERTKRGLDDDVAIVRVEELCPFPAHSLQQVMGRYRSTAHHVWAQEEPRNMGAWTFVAPRFTNVVGAKLDFAGREAHAAPAVGIATMHQEQTKKTFDDAFS